MSKSPRVVLLIYPHAAYDRAFFRGVIRYTREHEPWVFYLAWEYLRQPVASNSLQMAPTSDRRRRTRSSDYLPDFEDWGPTGVLGRLTSPTIEQQIYDSGLPLIGVELSSEQSERCPSNSRMVELVTDSQRAGRLAAEHLMERGFQRFAYCGYSGRHWSDRRGSAFVERLQEACFPCDIYTPSKKVQARYWDREVDLVCEWLNSLPKPVGLFCCNDIRGRQLLEACQLSGIRVPAEVSVVGADNDELIYSTTEPALSSVVFDAETGGYQAAQLLDALMKGEDVPKKRIFAKAMRVVARKSSDIIAVEDAGVAAAMAFIRDHVSEPILVTDVVEHVKSSRRSLEMKFRELLGVTIGEEIRRVRLTRVERLLTDTNLPTYRIAELTGFNSLQYLSRVFQQELKIPMAEYRRQHQNL